MGLGRGLEALLSANREESAGPFVRRPAAAGESRAAGGNGGAGAGGVLDLDPAQIVPGKTQPRKRFADEALASLTASVRENGLLQPVVVRKTEKGYELVAGERRWRAARALRLARIPARVITADDEKALELALVENIQREDLNPIEKAQAFHDLMRTFSLTQEQVAKKVGLERSTVANFLRLLTLPEMVQQKVALGALSMGHARALLALGDEKKILAAADRIAREGGTVRDAEMIAATEAPTRPHRAGPRARRPSDPVVASYEERLTKALGVKVRVRARGGRGRIVVPFRSDSEFLRLMGLLERRFTV